MRVAAYQAPLLQPGSDEALRLLRDTVKSCEARGVDILCCPEAILGGLADYAADPRACAIETRGVVRALTPLASDIVTTIVGFTEAAEGGALYNAAAILHRGSVLGVYRKSHPAINRSVYTAGHETPVFLVGDLTFGIVICNDSNHPDIARAMVARGARVLFVPTNNGMPPDRGYLELVAETRRLDIASALEHRVWVIRADVAGRAATLLSDGATGIVDPDGMVVATAAHQVPDLLIVDIDPSQRSDTFQRVARDFEDR